MLVLLLLLLALHVLQETHAPVLAMIHIIRLKVEELNPILEKHKQAICDTTGRAEIGWMLGWIKVKSTQRWRCCCCTEER